MWTPEPSDIANDRMHMNPMHHHEYPHIPAPYSDLHHQPINPAEYANCLMNYGVQLPSSMGVSGLGKPDHDLPAYDLSHHHQPTPEQHLIDHQMDMKEKKSPKNKCVSKEKIKDKDGSLIYSYTYLMKNSNGEEHLQKINIKKKSGKSKTSSKDTKGKKGKKDKEKSTKKAKKNSKKEETVIKQIDIKGMKNHEILRYYIAEHLVQIKSYNKFTVSRVLQDFKRDYPTVKISYGTVKKLLEEKGLLPEK